MVERVIAAIEATYDCPDGRGEIVNLRDVARAAIEAMREPTDAMADVGEMAVFEARRATDKWAREIKEKTGGLPAFQTDHAAQGWRAMIDAALTPR